MYGWQSPGQGFSLPAQRGNSFNILGFIKRDLSQAFYEFEQAMNAEMFEFCSMILSSNVKEINRL